jgi:hypothetical protein
MERWLTELRGTGIEITINGASTAARLERRFRAVDRYLERLVRRGHQLDLRGLGATLPPLPVKDVDADVRVLRDVDDSGSSADLVWPFLRRGRAVLTGLPGGGKSTSLEVLAAQLTGFAETSLPILVSLKDVDRQDHTHGFHDRLLNAALRELPETDRRLVQNEIEERLREGGMTLLLDSLDETYDRRSQVVTEIEDFLAHVSVDVDVLLATRDVAYGQAATLGWPDLRLVAPREIARTVEAVLRHAARQHFRSSADASRVDAWIAERSAWINEALESDSTLHETPLLPILLTLLAIERENATLPKGRAFILASVVEDVVKRKEMNRPSTFALGDLHNGAAAEAALEAFAVEAATIMQHGGQCPFSNLVDAVATALAPDWGLSPGNARITAEAMIRFWDESGIFVIAGTTESVAPRITLFAEIGDAMAAAKKREPELRNWVRERVRAGGVEPLVLAAGLSPVAAQEVAAIAGTQNERELLHATVRAVREGAVLEDEWLAPVIAGMLDDIRPGDSEAWESWSRLMELSVERLDQAVLVDALSAFPEPYQVVGRALVELRWRTNRELRENPRTLLDLLTITHLEKLSSRTPERSPWWKTLLVDNNLITAIDRAATILIGSVDETVGLTARQLSTAPAVLQKRLVELLKAHGHGHLAEQALAEEKAQQETSLALMRKYDMNAAQRILTSLADRPHAPLTYSERLRLDELADLLETLNINIASTRSWQERQEYFPEVVDLIATLGSFHLQAIAGQAAITLDRMAKLDRGNAAFFALLDLASSRDLTNWSAVTDHPAAVDLLMRMLAWGRGDALVAASALWGAPVADLAVPKLRTLIPRLAVSTEHHRIAAHILCSLVEGPEPEAWVNHESPVLRAVAALRCEPTTGDRLSIALRQLLWDDDGHVRTAALRRARSIQMTDRNEELSRIAEQPNPGWMCLRCKTNNEAGRSYCASCNTSGPNPRGYATKILIDAEIDEWS